MELWRKSIPAKNRPLSLSDFVCEHHFTEDCIQRHVTNISANGDSTDTNDSPLRARPRLKKGAVPTIFTSCPVSTRNSRKRKLPDEHTYSSLKKVGTNQSLIEGCLSTKN